MDRFTKHIISFIALVFLLAQGMQTLHFYLFHFDNSNLNSTVNVVTFSNEEVHHCDFVYSKVPLSFKNIIFKQETPEFSHIAESHIFSKKISVKKYKQTNFLRGPPGIIES